MRKKEDIDGNKKKIRVVKEEHSNKRRSIRNRNATTSLIMTVGFRIIIESVFNL